jgi:hypothetical protein
MPCLNPSIDPDQQDRNAVGHKFAPLLYQFSGLLSQYLRGFVG